MNLYKLIRPAIFTQDSERMHNLALSLGERVFSRQPFLGCAKRLFEYEHKSLAVDFLGLHFKNPVGLPGGFDKNARLLDFWPALGLGFVEIGSVTAGGGQGNSKPRMWRLPKDRALINHMGLPNIGALAVSQKLASRKTLSAIPLGINITKTHNPNISGDQAILDFCRSFELLSSFADYIQVNISCPNTAEGKTFEDPSALKALLGEIKKIANAQDMAKPLLLKISPDVSLAQLDGILEIGEAFGVSAYTLTNLSTQVRSSLKSAQGPLGRIIRGGVSGEPIRDKGNLLIAHVYKNLKRPCVVGLGGIFSPEQAYEKIKLGASLVQVYTGLIYEGPGLIKTIKQGLVELLRRDGFARLEQAVGTDVK